MVLGWSVTRANIGLLIPMTVINLGALVAIMLAIGITRAGDHEFKPFDPRPVTYAEPIDDEEPLPDEWREKVAHKPTAVRNMICYV